MPMTLQVMYPTDGGTTFDFDYYGSTHMEIVIDNMGAHYESVTVSKGLAGGPDVPPGYHAVATFTFADQAALDAGLQSAAPAVEDIPNFFSGAPQMLIGETIA